MKPTTAPQRARRVSSAQAGFTLVELMVALTGGLFMSVVVFALARDGSRFYQREARIADATLAVTAGFERLRADVMRAGFMASSNVQQDPTLCQATTALLGQLPPRLASVQVELPDQVPAGSDAANNGVTPRRLILAGNFTSVDQFPILGVVPQPGGAGYVVALQQSIGPLARANYAGLGAAQATYLAEAFPTGRLLRLVNSQGRTQYALISGVQAGSQPAVLLDTRAGDLVFRGANDCGLRDVESLASANVVNFIQYEIRRATSAGYAILYNNSPNPFDASRTELIREELDPLTGDAFPNTEEIVAEYAVDLAVGATVANTIVGTNVGTLTILGFNDAAVTTTWAADPVTLNNPSQGPHRLRALRVRLAVRSREPDREANLVGTATGAVAPGLYRVGLSANGNGPFARVRIAQADLALHNQMGSTR